MRTFRVNVRAVVRVALAESGNTLVDLPGWEVYDRDDREGGEVVLRCDQLVTVQAEDAESAVEAAKADASDVAPDQGAVEDVRLWVDEGIDVEVLETEGSVL